MLQLIADGIVYSLLRLDADSHLGQAVNFFVYDSLKIMLMLFGMIAVVGFLRTYLPQEKIRQWLAKGGGMGNFLAAIFGAVTPFCSCSSIPLFFGFLKAGVPLGVTFSFLITSPLINEYLVVLMLGFFGWKITLAYVISGMFIGVFSGLVLGKLSLERFLEKDMLDPSAGSASADPAVSCACIRYEGMVSRIRFGINEAVSIVAKLWLWILAGVALGALIHNYVPQELIQNAIARAGIFSVPLATLLGVPMYGSCAAIVPVAVVLFQKGIPLGTALSFMMAVAALSLPEAIMLRRAMKLPLIAVFFGITTCAIILTGYLFNFLSKFLA
jgi:uncharacterized protein